MGSTASSSLSSALCSRDRGGDTPLPASAITIRKKRKWGAYLSASPIPDQLARLKPFLYAPNPTYASSTPITIAKLREIYPDRKSTHRLDNLAFACARDAESVEFLMQKFGIAFSRDAKIDADEGFMWPRTRSTRGPVSLVQLYVENQPGSESDAILAMLLRARPVCRFPLDNEFRLFITQTATIYTLENAIVTPAVRAFAAHVSDPATFATCAKYVTGRREWRGGIYNDPRWDTNPLYLYLKRGERERFLRLVRRCCPRSVSADVVRAHIAPFLACEDVVTVRVAEEVAEVEEVADEN